MTFSASNLCLHIAVLNILFINAKYPCPCKKHSHFFLTKRTLCILYYEKLPSFNSESINIFRMDNLNKSSTCDVIMQLIENKNVSFNGCPDKCLPVPYIQIPKTWIFTLPRQGVHLTCSSIMNQSQILNSIDLLEMIFWRRLQECSETRIPNIPAKYRQRLPLESLFITIGTNLNKDFIRLQQSVLQGAQTKTITKSSPFHTIGMISTLNISQFQVISWSAFEDLYPCNNFLTKIMSNNYKSNSHNNISSVTSIQFCTDRHYEKYMPESTMVLTNKSKSKSSSSSSGHTGRRSRPGVGWICAQRRPLRALAHTLLLYEPNNVFLGDDDTYLNYPLYQSFMASRRKDKDEEEAAVYCYMEYPGQVSKRGFCAGGTGYILTKPVLDRLTRYSIPVPDGTNRTENIPPTTTGFATFTAAVTAAVASSKTTKATSTNHGTIVDDIYMHHLSLAKAVMKTFSIFSKSKCIHDIESSDCHSNVCDFSCIHLPSIKSSHTIDKLLYIDKEEHSIYRNSMNTSTSKEKRESNRQGTVGQPIIQLLASTRLVDICVNLWADSQTCHHSDHSMTRCLLYGAMAEIVPMSHFTSDRPRQVYGHDNVAMNEKKTEVHISFMTMVLCMRVTSTAQFSDFQMVFRHFDSSGDGYLSLIEIKHSLVDIFTYVKRSQLTSSGLFLDKDVEVVLKALDEDEDGSVSLEEFLSNFDREEHEGHLGKKLTLLRTKAMKNTSSNSSHRRRDELIPGMSTGRAVHCMKNKSIRMPCDTRTHVSCHRYQPTSLTDSSPISTGHAWSRSS